MCYTGFFISKTSISNVRLKLATKISKSTLSNPLRLNFYYLKIIYILHPRFRSKEIGRTLKNKQHKQASLYSWDYRINHNENGEKKKNRSHTYDINRFRSRYKHKYNKYKKCVIMIMFTCTKPTSKQHLKVNSWKS